VPLLGVTVPLTTPQRQRADHPSAGGGTMSRWPLLTTLFEF
jgi:hypothetical protein